jgi:glyoxylase-like metal-dependent hydrolase (beta-lactamase superfamily II)
MPFRDLHEGYVEEWIDSLKRVEAMDFDVLLPGHGPVGRKSHVREFRVFLETLADGVLDAMRRRQNLDQIREAMRLERYANWMGYEQMRALNVEGMHRYWTVFSRRTPA